MFDLQVHLCQKNIQIKDLSSIVSTTGCFIIIHIIRIREMVKVSNRGGELNEQNKLQLSTNELLES